MSDIYSSFYTMQSYEIYLNGGCVFTFLRNPEALMCL
jgi:hypothetical protein